MHPPGKQDIFVRKRLIEEEKTYNSILNYPYPHVYFVSVLSVYHSHLISAVLQFRYWKIGVQNLNSPIDFKF